MKVTYDLYYFDIQNGPEILQGAQPVVVEVGPYSFNEYYVKFDIEWSDGGDTVTYNTQKYYVFNQEKSGPGLTQDDSLTLPYATAVGFQFLLGTLPPELPFFIDAKINVSGNLLTKLFSPSSDRLSVSVRCRPS